MINAVLKDTITKKEHDLTALISKHKKISVGRAGFGSTIELGKDVNPYLTQRTSKNHATITYEDPGSFFLYDNSINGTRINNKRIFSGEKKPLADGDKIWFADYGPVVYEEVK